MDNAGHRGRSYTVSSGKASRFSFIVFGLSFVVFGIPYIVLWGFDAFRLAFTSFLTEWVELIVTILGGMAAHELLHAVTFAMFCRKSFRSVSFGFNPRHLAPYVTCREYLSIRQYGMATLMPGVVLGILPGVISLISGTGWLLIFSFFFTAGAAGDFLSAIDLQKVPANARVLDHPTEAGFLVSV